MFSRLQRTMELIQYASDLHLEKGFPRIIRPHKPFLILLGDIGYIHSQIYKYFLHNVSNDFEKVFVLSGNHEYDNYRNNIKFVEDKIRNICSQRNNLFYLQKETHEICKDENIHLIGCTLWSKLPKSKFKYHEEHVDYLKNTISFEKNKYFVVATHHCPLFQCINVSNNYTPNYFASNQQNLFDNENIICWIHGHSHINRDFIFKDKWVLSNQYGKFLTSCRKFKN